MLAPWEEEAYYEWQLRERQAALRDAALDWQSLQQSSRDILMQIPEAEGLREWHLENSGVNHPALNRS